MTTQSSTPPLSSASDHVVSALDARFPWRAFALVTSLLSLSSCGSSCEPIPEGPTVRIESPAQDQFVGTTPGECLEIGVTGRIYNVERLEDFELYVQGKRVRRIEIRPSTPAGTWEFATTVDFLPTSEVGMGPPTLEFTTEYPRYPWLASRAAGWENRVRPILAELVRPADRSDLAAFVSRDLHTVIDTRRSNCQSWEAAFTQDEVPGVIAMSITPDGLVALSPVMQERLPHPELPSPQADIDAQIRAGVIGPTGAESCVSYAEVQSADPSLETAHDSLVATALAANAAAQAASLPPVYPNPLSADNWLVCARWTSTFDALAWSPPEGVLVDPTPETPTGPARLASSWEHPGAFFQLFIQGEDVRVGWSRLGSIDPALVSSASLGRCATAGEASVSSSATFGVRASTDVEQIEVVTTTLGASAESEANAIPYPCNTGAWRDSAETLMADAASWIAGLYEGALAQGAPRSHPALALEDALEGAIPGRWTAEAQGTLVTQPVPDYTGGVPGVCDADQLGLTLLHDLEVGPGPAGWEGGWLHWGGSLVDERDGLSSVGYAGDPTTCHESEYIADEWIMEGVPPTASLLFTTAYPNALMGVAVNADLDGTRTYASDPDFIANVATALGLPRAAWTDLVVTLDARQPSFVSPEWHPQVGHWVVSLRRASDDALLSESIFNLWATSGWDIATTGGALDDHAEVGFAGFTLEAAAVAGTLRPGTGVLLSTFGPLLRALFAAHAISTAREVGWPEWVNVEGGPWFSTATDAIQRWQDNRALLPYTLVP